MHGGQTQIYASFSKFYIADTDSSFPHHTRPPSSPVFKISKKKKCFFNLRPYRIFEKNKIMKINKPFITCCNIIFKLNYAVKKTGQPTICRHLGTQATCYLLVGT